MKKTKIMATIGPACESEEIIEKMILEGVNIFRFNLKHNTFEWHKKMAKRVKEVATKNNRKIGIMLDLQGPEVRIETKEGFPVEIKKGGVFWINRSLDKDNRVIKIDPEVALKFIKKNQNIFIDDGSVEGRVKGHDGRGIKIEVEEDSIINHRKSLNIISEELDLPILARRDKETIDRLSEINPDYISLSFVRDETDIVYLKKIIKKIDPEIKIIAKIENQRAVKNIEKIIEKSDGILIARGDLGIEIPIEQLAFWQKKITDLCRLSSKPVIVATQMLQSMTENNRPTRAEVTDVSNAVFDGIDVLTLSDETSVGKNPIKVIREMSKIINFTENSMMTRKLIIEPKTSTEVLVDAAVNIIQSNQDLKIGGVIIFTQSGNTARIFSRYRINLPIIAVTDNTDTAKGLTVSYGVEPYLEKFEKASFNMPLNLINRLVEAKVILKGESLLVMHGNNWMESGSTSDISLVTV